MRVVGVDEEKVGGGGVTRCGRVDGAVGGGKMSWCKEAHGNYYLRSDGLVVADSVVAVYSTLTVVYRISLWHWLTQALNKG